ncbi:Response regulator receiver [Tenacibaculum sediminilitoris]|uniref:response regulator n=1 Tax=Tenacibaculum sediminilitoris TaxID=1820334 RepID=UPI003892DA30
MKKLNLILLIDDDAATNFFHKLILEKENCCENIVCKENGEDALEYLSTKTDNEYPAPELIFLDINMPRMNGWEFLKAYEELEAYKKAKKVIIMLTTSLNPTDKEKAKEIVSINDFMSKPLTSKKIQSILNSFDSFFQ